MIRKQSAISKGGFTLVELMITMVMFVLVIAAASQVLTSLLTQFKQQSKIAETNIEGIIGLEILRRDIEHAGYGLPWDVTGIADPDDDGNFWEHLTNYYEAASIGCTPNTADFNDGNAATGTGGNPPRAILSGNNASFSGCGANSVFNGSDYLVIKSTNVAISNASQRWTRLGTGNVKRDDLSGDPSFADLGAENDRVIVISPGSTSARSSLVVREGAFFTTYDNTSGFAPIDATETRVIYGIDNTGDFNPRMPFNRADYYIWRESTTPSTDEVPDRCADDTGILRKTVISQNNGQRMAPLPLVDCVADMQVVYCLDNDNDGDCEVGVAGSTDSYSDDISTQNAQWIRESVREVRVYILAHEGQYDRNYTYPNATITVGEFGLGRDFDLTGITDWQRYRWKVYTLVVKPDNLR